MDRLRGEPSYRPCMMLKDIHRDYGVELNYNKVWKGKELAMHDIHGVEEGAYDRLRWTLVFLDDTHIKNKYKGCILVAVAKDANDDLFTLAYSVVDAENDDNWIISSCEAYPLHNKKYWSSVFKKAAYALSRQEFQEHINNIIRSMPLAKDFIVSLCPKSWANACFLGNRWGVMNNNIAESWNNWVKTTRFLPIVPMVDHIRIQIMDMMHRRREATMGMVKKLSPSKENALAKTYAESRSLKLRKECGWSFEVVDGDKSFAVDLSAMTCSCRAWQVNRFPCKHACAAIESKSLSLYDFCDKYFKIDLYHESYRGILNPIPTCHMYKSNPEHPFVINAPDVRSQPGRRRTQRIPLQVEKRVTKCGRCDGRGHNRCSCKEAIN
ncbi:hypothetical protein ZIOFF_020465 [Zingiber officinale]|uniref:SWIM-type domain-containing protein n=1 Tax=Zingiber officinale TaxID=94328 RepID=A0A8J5LGM8_ZINOF|nr:hypothetical protein ZIOFF_020465 [Zingiber officinale]